MKTNAGAENGKSEANLGFPVGGSANPAGGANIRFCQFSRKTA